MDYCDFVVSTLVIGGTCSILGLMLGRWVERGEWLTRAIPPGDTPHHCDGRFYYVIEESYFCREFVRKPADEEPLGLTEYLADEQEGE